MKVVYIYGNLQIINLDALNANGMMSNWKNKSKIKKKLCSKI